MAINEYHQQMKSLNYDVNLLKTEGWTSVVPK